jgi:ferredoxin-like protein FixX
VHQVGHYPELYQDARSTKHKTKTTNTIKICNAYCFSTAKMVTRIYLNVKSCLRCLSCFQKKATAFHNPQSWSFTASNSISTFFVQWRTKSRKPSLNKLMFLVMCIFLDTSLVGNALHSIKSDMRDWEFLTAVLLTF